MAGADAAIRFVNWLTFRTIDAVDRVTLQPVVVAARFCARLWGLAGLQSTTPSIFDLMHHPASQLHSSHWQPRYLSNMLKFIFVGIGSRSESITGDTAPVRHLPTVSIIMAVFVPHLPSVWACHSRGRISH